MTITKHELSQGFKSFLIWTISISFLVIICVFMYPEMKTKMESASEMFASMGVFTQAFSMDRLDFGSFLGFYSIECGNMLGIGGAFFASLIAIAALSKEEKDKTAEFLLSHPIQRTRVIAEKLIAVLVQIILMNLCVYLLSALSGFVIEETIAWKEFTLIHLAYLLMQLEVAGICFGISAFQSRGNIGLGLGLSALFYFLNIIGNISDKAKFLKYISPFGYTEAADIIERQALDTLPVVLGMIYMVVFIGAAFVWYKKKDIQ